MQGKVQHKTHRLAVLVDADNVEASLIEPILKEITNYGIASVKRIYGHWTSPQLSGWKEKLHEFAIQPIQQFSYTSGRNSTDSALIIDVMDLLYTNKSDGFCIISSDSDFTKLACRLPESGLIVYGFAEERKTPKAFIKACYKFIYNEIFKDLEVKEKRNFEATLTKGERVVTQDAQQGWGKTSFALKSNEDLLKLGRSSYEAIIGEDEWANLAEMGGQLNKLSPSFDARNYGYKKLGKLNGAINLFEINEIPNENNPALKVLYIKLKK